MVDGKAHRDHEQRGGDVERVVGSSAARLTSKRWCQFIEAESVCRAVATDLGSVRSMQQCRGRHFSSGRAAATARTLLSEVLERRLQLCVRPARLRDECAEQCCLHDVERDGLCGERTSLSRAPKEKLPSHAGGYSGPSYAKGLVCADVRRERALH